MLKRILDEKLFSGLFKGETIILQGARKVGKTTLLKEIQKKYPAGVFLNADEPAIAALLSRASKDELNQIIAKNRLMVIDDAQKLPDPGHTLKFLTETFPQIQLVLSSTVAIDASMAFGKLNTGQTKSIQLFAISFEEWKAKTLLVKTTDTLEERLVYGMFPEVLNNPKNQESVLKELTNELLLKDMLSHGNPRKPSEIKRLLQLLAHQVCGELNYSDLAESLGIDIKTAIRYVDLLEQAFIVFRLPSFSQKVKTEITKGRKIYFCDNGIRNALIDQFQAFGKRVDKDLLWENFMVCERLKFNNYHRRNVHMHFWRTIQHQEIDLVEERDGFFKAFQFKYSTKKAVRIPLTFSRNYPTGIQTINGQNFESFISV
jgi:uncharacterized protein